MLNDGIARPSPGAITVALVATTAVQAVASFAVLALPAVAPEVAAALGVRPSLIGYQISLVYLGATGCSVIAGALVRRWGPCRASQACLALIGAGALLAAIPHLAAMVVGSLVIGIGYGITNPAASTLLVRYAPAARRNLLFSIKQTGVPLGGVLAGLLAPAVALAWGWSSALVVVAGQSFALALALHPGRAAWDQGRVPHAPLFGDPLGGLLLVARSPALAWLSHACFWYSFVQLCLVGFLVTLLVTEAGFGLVEAGIVLSAAQVAGVVGRVAWGWVADRSGDGLAVLVGLGAAMAALAGIGTLVAPGWSAMAVVVLFSLFGATAIGWNGVYMANVARLSPAGQVASATGGSLVIIFAGVLVGPAAFSAIAEAIGRQSTAFWTLVVAGAIGVVSAWMARRQTPPGAGRAADQP